jgi:hypothetical protein
VFVDGKVALRDCVAALSSEERSLDRSEGVTLGLEKCGTICVAVQGRQIIGAEIPKKENGPDLKTVVKERQLRTHG